ncbi:MAG: hypothetical protein HN348_05185 [Proteobacteria bacterium]|jgi:hypothetical protein|nr:hypothetical protein [Pseudomonadota bacterium]
MRGWCFLAVVALMGSCADTPNSPKTKTVIVEDPNGPLRESETTETGTTMKLKGGEEFVYVDKNPSYIDCVITHCTKKEARDHRICRQNVCALKDSSWDVTLKKVSYDGNKVNVEVETSHNRGSYANIRESAIDVWLGLTVRRADGTRHDFPVVDFVAEDGVKTHQFEGEIGADLDGIVASVWQKKVSCTVGSHGCETYGYAFDKSIYSNPDLAFKYYVDFNRLPKDGKETWHIQNAGNSPEELAKLVEVTQALGDDFFEPYDFVSFKAEAVGTADSEHKGVWYKHLDDRKRAAKIAGAVNEALGTNVRARQWEEAPAPLVVAVAPTKVRPAPKTTTPEKEPSPKLH